MIPWKQRRVKRFPPVPPKTQTPPRNRITQNCFYFIFFQNREESGHLTTTMMTMTKRLQLMQRKKTMLILKSTFGVYYHYHHQHQHSVVAAGSFPPAALVAHTARSVADQSRSRWISRHWASCTPDEHAINFFLIFFFLYWQFASSQLYSNNNLCWVTCEQNIKLKKIKKKKNLG